MLQLLRNKNQFGSLENKPSGHFKKILQDQSNALCETKSLINKRNISTRIISIQVYFQGDVFLAEDEAQNIIVMKQTFAVMYLYFICTRKNCSGFSHRFY